MQLLALSLDLDDTLWPVVPAIEHAERQLDQWLRCRHPRIADAFPVPALRRLRERISEQRPDLAHDFSAQRRLTLTTAFAACGESTRGVDEAFEVYFEARNQVELYPDAAEALERLARRLPLIGLTNGNADLGRIGLERHFRFCLSAREAGCAKPATRIFHAACRRLGVPPEAVLHIGDDPALDVVGARVAGLRSAWINRGGLRWEHGQAPDLEFNNLIALADWCDQHTGIADAAPRPGALADSGSDHP